MPRCVVSKQGHSPFIYNILEGRKHNAHEGFNFMFAILIRSRSHFFNQNCKQEVKKDGHELATLGKETVNLAFPADKFEEVDL